MKQKQYHSLEELPLMMNMTDVAAALGISRAGAYKLAHNADFPAFQIGKRIVVSREKFIDWLNWPCAEEKPAGAERTRAESLHGAMRSCGAE